MAHGLRAVLFDQDGTLINTFIPAMHAYSVATGRTITLAELEPVAHLGAARNLLSALMGREATDADDEIFHEALGEAVAAIEPYPGIVDLLTTLRADGLATGVATNSDARSAQVVLGAHALTDFFDVIVTVDQVSGPKPNPESVLLAVSRLGLDPGECAFVGDGNGDMGAAREAGVLAVAAGWGHQSGTIEHDLVDVWADEPADILRLATAD